MNEDIVGQSFDAGHLGTLTITGTACWSPNYVNVASEDGKYQSVRNAGLVRLALQIQEDPQ